MTVGKPSSFPDNEGGVAPDEAAGRDGPATARGPGSPIEFRLDPSSGVPTYLQLVQQVEHALRLGYLKPGDQVQVRYMDQAGKATAVAIQVKSGAAAAKSTGQPAEKK